MRASIFVLMIFVFGFGRDPFSIKMAPKDNLQSVQDEINRPLENVDIGLPSTARVLKKVQIVYQNIDGSISEKTIDINQNIDWHTPLRLSQDSDIQALELQRTPRVYAGNKDIRFSVVDKSIKIITKYTIVRNFVAISPYKIIIDVRRGDENVEEVVKINRKYFSTIEISSHKDFYRIAILLDGRYKYNVQQDKDGYIITLQ